MLQAMVLFVRVCWAVAGLGLLLLAFLGAQMLGAVEFRPEAPRFLIEAFPVRAALSVVVLAITGTTLLLGAVRTKKIPRG